MKAELVYGRLIKIEDDTITLEIKKSGDRTEVEYPLGIELDEKWVGDNLGCYFYAVIVDGKVTGFRSE
jgi:hypothetical protein